MFHSIFCIEAINNIEITQKMFHMFIFSLFEIWKTTKLVMLVIFNMFWVWKTQFQKTLNITQHITVSNVKKQTSNSVASDSRTYPKRCWTQAVPTHRKVVEAFKYASEAILLQFGTFFISYDERLIISSDKYVFGRRRYN